MEALVRGRSVFKLVICLLVSVAGAFQHIAKLKVFDTRLLYTATRLTFFKNE